MCRSELEKEGWTRLCSAWCVNAEVAVFEKAQGGLMTYTLAAHGQVMGVPGRYLSAPDVSDMETAMVELGLLRAKPEGFQHEHAANIDGDNPFNANFLHPALRDRAVLEFFVANPEIALSDSDVVYFELEPDGAQHSEVYPSLADVESQLHEFHLKLRAQEAGQSSPLGSPEYLMR
jgi:hypothetical protein